MEQQIDLLVRSILRLTDYIRKQEENRQALVDELKRLLDQGVGTCYKIRFTKNFLFITDLQGRRHKIPLLSIN